MGYDLFTPIDFEIQLQEQKLIFTDLAVGAPEGHYVQIISKSGLTVSYELEVKAGVIDPDFTGNIGVVLKNNCPTTLYKDSYANTCTSISPG